MRMTVSAVLLGGSRAVADQLENFLHVLNVVFARFFRLGVVLGVVVAIGHAQAALIDVGDYVLGVVRILRSSQPRNSMELL